MDRDIFVVGRISMKILMYQDFDFEDDEEADISAVASIATPFDYLRALWLYLFLSSNDGISFIEHLHVTRTSVVLRYMRNPLREFDSMKVVISGRGLMMQYRKGSEVVEDPISCLYACCFWGCGKHLP